MEPIRNNGSVSTKENIHNNFLANEDVIKIVTNYTEEQNFIVKKFTVKRASDKMMGFLAEYWKLGVSIAINGETKLLHFFIKSIARNNEGKAKMVRELKLFEKEATFYSLIKPTIEIRDSKPWSAKLAAVFENDLVLEDLTAVGFKTRDKLNHLDVAHCKQALEAIARFHSSTIIYEEIKRKTNKHYTLLQDFKQLSDTGGYISTNSWFYQCMNGAFEAMKEFSKFGRDHKDFHLIESKWCEIWITALDIADHFKSNINVICHRDLWNNNLLFHYGVSNAPDDCILVDFQAIRYQPPASDVMLFLYCNLQPAIREEKLQCLLQYYYSHLAYIMYNYEISLEEILPMKEFLKSADEQRQWGLVIACCLTPQIWMDDVEITTIFSDPEQFNQILTSDKATFIKRMMLKNEGYKEKVLQLFEEIVSRYILLQ